MVFLFPGVVWFLRLQIFVASVADIVYFFIIVTFILRFLLIKLFLNSKLLSCFYLFFPLLPCWCVSYSHCYFCLFLRSIVSVVIVIINFFIGNTILVLLFHYYF